MASKVISLSGKKRIYLVDGQPLVREWFSYALNEQPDMAVCGEAANISTAMRGIVAANPHVAVIDLFFEDGSGFELIEKIIARCSRTAVLVFSTHDEVYYAERVILAGARGYISKKEPSQRILAALRCILQGKVYLSPTGVQHMLSNRGGTSVPRKSVSMEILSNREIEVFAMLGRGLGARRIAEMLHVSPKTVHAYCARIKVKLRLRDGNELLREAIRWIEKVSRLPIKLPRPHDQSPVGVIDLSPRGFERPSMPLKR